MYYEKYPEDIHRVQDLVRHIEKKPILLPSGGNLSILRLRQLGMLFGFHGMSPDDGAGPANAYDRMFRHSTRYIPKINLSSYG